MNKTQLYDLLADHLSDHLWMQNALDFDLLKNFEEFFYKGPAYRIIYVTNESDEIRSFQFQSFSKTLEGISIFTKNTEIYDKDFCEKKKPILFSCEIEGFDVSKALLYFKEKGGISERTLKFINEEEVLAYTVTDTKKIS